MLRVVVCGVVVLVGVSFVATPERADARPQYLKEFADKYKNLESQAKDSKCLVCHFGDKKTNNNDYGIAIKKVFGEEKNVKDVAKITEAFAKAEQEKSTANGGKTFGELIKEGKLPGTNPEE
jgi:cytochrome c2